VLTPREYSFATPKDLGGKAAYRTFCRRVDLPATPGGYGLLHAEDEDGQRWTLITQDVAYARMLAAASHDVVADLEVPADKFPLKRQGWPDAWDLLP
jgi:hypothetical protein